MTVHVGDFQVSLATGEVFRGQQRIRLQEKPFQVLKALLEHRGEMVTREELRQKLWSTGVFVDFDRSLKTAISKLRKALGDSAQNPRLIETLPRRGYRLVAPVKVRGAATQPVNRARNHRVMLAVLPFKNLSSNVAREYFSEGVTEEIISQLGRSHSRQLGVIARTSVVKYKRTAKTVEQIARELNVGHILEGSVRFSGKRVRISARLVHAGDQAYLWAESYDGDWGDALGLQSQVAQAITNQITVKLASSLN
jgi:TolB-like protein